MTPEALAEGPGGPVPPVTSLYVWGQERADVNRAAELLAGRLDPRYLWVEADDRSAPVPTGPTLGPRRAEAPETLVPGAGIPEVLLWTYLRAQGQRHLGRELLEFLRLPGPVQEAVAELRARRGPRVLVVANVDRLGAFDPVERGLYGQFVEYLNAQEITLVLASTSRPRIERIDFEYSVTLASSLPGPVRPGPPICQWGDCASCVVKGFFRPAELACIGELSAPDVRSPPDGAAVPGFASH